MSSLKRRRNNRTRWIAGDVLSWALGVTLGVVLGVVLLIVLPRTLPKPGGAAAPSTEGTVTAPAETPQGGNGTQSAAANAAMGNDSNTADESAQGEVAPTGGTRDSDIQTTPQADMSGGDTAASDSNGTAEQPAAGTEDSTAGTDDSGTGDTATGATDANDNGAQTAEQQRAATAEDTSNTQNPDDQTGTNAGTTQGTDPAEAAASSTDPAGDPGNGGAVFASNCAGCHGANAGGNIGPALTTADGPKSWTLAEFTLALRQGKTPERELNATMPRFSETQLTDEQIADVQAYIKTLN